jgi:hypothetical protein
MVYFAYFHSVVMYGVVFKGNSTNISRVFKLQKRVIRIIYGAGVTLAEVCLGSWMFYYCLVNIFSL